MGTDKPSGFLRRCRALARGDPATNEETARRIWLGGMPEAIRIYFECIAEKDLSTLAQRADRMMSAAQTMCNSELSHIAAVDHRPGLSATVMDALGKLANSWRTE